MIVFVIAGTAQTDDLDRTHARSVSILSIIIRDRHIQFALVTASV